MKRAFLCGVVAICLSYPASNAFAQTMSHEEEVVRNAYAKFSFLCSMPPITNAAVPQLADVKVDTVQLDAKVAYATPVYDLSDFQTGSIASIANDTWAKFVTPPQSPSLGGEILMGGAEIQSYSDGGNETSWQMTKVQWNPSPNLSPEGARIILSKTVSEIIKIGSKQWQPANMPLVAYTRYAAFTVDVKFQGKSSGPHKAIFFFGTDSKGKEYVATNDVISGPSPLDNAINFPSDFDPSGLLLNKVRETPIVADWLRANVIADSSCSVETTALCCSHGRCGISSPAFNRALATPLPTPKY